MRSWNDLWWWIQNLYDPPHNTPSLHPQNYGPNTASAIDIPLWFLVSNISKVSFWLASL